MDNIKHLSTTQTKLGWASKNTEHYQIQVKSLRWGEHQLSLLQLLAPKLFLQVFHRAECSSSCWVLELLPVVTLPLPQLHNGCVPQNRHTTSPQGWGGGKLCGVPFTATCSCSEQAQKWKLCSLSLRDAPSIFFKLNRANEELRRRQRSEALSSLLEREMQLFKIYIYKKRLSWKLYSLTVHTTSPSTFTASWSHKVSPQTEDFLGPGKQRSAVPHSPECRTIPDPKTHSISRLTNPILDGR